MHGNDYSYAWHSQTWTAAVSMLHGTVNTDALRICMPLRTAVLAVKAGIVELQWLCSAVSDTVPVTGFGAVISQPGCYECDIFETCPAGSPRQEFADQFNRLQDLSGATLEWDHTAIQQGHPHSLFQACVG